MYPYDHATEPLLADYFHPTDLEAELAQSWLITEFKKQALSCLKAQWHSNGLTELSTYWMERPN